MMAYKYPRESVKYIGPRQVQFAFHLADYFIMSVSGGNASGRAIRIEIACWKETTTIPRRNASAAREAKSQTVFLLCLLY